LSTQRAQIDALTGLRGIAACWVVIYHMHEFDAIPDLIALPLRHGYLAVDVFFVLSGFVMALNYKHLFAHGFSKENFAVFIMRRIARIYPLYIAITLVLVALSLRHLDDSFRLNAFVYNGALNILLVEMWGLGSPIDGPSWSISTEAAAYLLFPLLSAVGLFGRGKYAVIVGLFCLIILLFLTTLPTPPSYPFPRQGPLDISWGGFPWPLIKCIAEFSIGLLSFRAYENPMIFSIVSKPTCGAMIVAGIAAALFISNLDVAFVLLVPALVISLCSKNLGAKMLSSPLAVFFGEISYAMYLLHYPLLRIRPAVTSHLGDIIGADLADFAALLLFYGMLLVSSWICFKCIEEPGRRLIRNIERSVFPRADALLGVNESLRKSASG
jgi:peptidoglycan/LPS O-acetylase OafA/YrhL